MSVPAAGFPQTVEYSMDKWFMDRVPWALLTCLAGLACVLYADNEGGNGPVLAIVYLAMLALVCAGLAAATLIEDRSGLPFYVTILIGLLIFVVVVSVTALIAFGVGSRPGSPSIGRLRWGEFFNPPIHVFGWLLIYLGSGWTGYALLRHFYPARPILMLSPAGITYHRGCLKNLLIPWQEVHGVGPLESENASGFGSRFPQATAVVVTQAFYEQHIAPKRGMLAPPGFERIFQPKGAMMQMVLTQAEIIIFQKDLRELIDVRWKAFLNQPPPAPAAGEPPGPPVVYGRWSIDGSWWQAIQFLTPLVGMGAVVLHASNL